MLQYYTLSYPSKIWTGIVQLIQWPVIGWMTKAQFPAGTGYFSSSPQSDWFWDWPSLVNGYQEALPLEAEWPEYEAHHLTQPNIKFRLCAAVPPFFHVFMVLCLSTQITSSRFKQVDHLCNCPVGFIPPHAINKLVISIKKLNPGKQRNQVDKLAWTKAYVSPSVSLKKISKRLLSQTLTLCFFRNSVSIQSQKNGVKIRDQNPLPPHKSDANCRMEKKWL
jgi:hypothetical protein